MSDRRDALQEVADQLVEYDGIRDAFLAKSFTDRLLIVDVERDRELPDPALALLDEHDLRGIEEVYGEDSERRSVVGDVGDATRHHFVDVQTRGDHQSYVVDT
ncbi:hypothetical protein GRX03_07415 [Halovenus sp. WSH3]|uniref:Uncharacterized protein n=1 Tax=Halovenus carboxidivorans TaxID=2692199 RepID=A0A6B0T991_9EURY|nr:hypothetical protein [Halovenus carboxidivorans]MXR51430.1 hypothetical protein [Halovenus carboxidivorans]